MSNSLRLYHNIEETLTEFHPALRKTRLQNLAWMMTGLHMAEHVHLSEIADHRVGAATLPSKVRQLRRFLANEHVDPHGLYQPVRRLLLKAAARHGRVRLLIDTLELTGKRQIQVVALAYRRRALPLAWRVYRRTGLTEANTQIRLLGAIKPDMPEEAEVVLMGDGEFHAVRLLQWLERQGWHYRLRLHADTWARLREGAWHPLGDLIEQGERRYLDEVHVTKEHAHGPVSLALQWAEGEEHPWLIACDERATYLRLRDYSRRMWIEELFGDLEDGGFHLNRSRLYEPERLSRLMMALSWVYTWLMHVGAYVTKRGWRRLVDRNDRRDRSYVELGRHWIRRSMTNDDLLHMGLKPYY